MIELRDLRRVFAGPSEVTALEGADLRVSEGEWVAITGPSGAGKSTLLNLIGLLDLPTSGSYLLKGVDITSLGHNQRAELRSRLFGFVFQAFHMINSRTVLENVDLGLMYAGVPRRQRASRAEEAVAGVGLSYRAHARVSTLSGGEKQRVAIARALASEASILLCDEPTGNLDSETGARVLSEVSRAHQQGVTVIMITHNTEVAGLAGRIIPMSSGRVLDQRR